MMAGLGDQRILEADVVHDHRRGHQLQQQRADDGADDIGPTPASGVPPTTAAGDGVELDQHAEIGGIAYC